MMTTSEVPTTSGLLKLISYGKEITTAQCTGCGYFIAIPSVGWGPNGNLGCPSCHQAEKVRQEKEAEAELTEARKKERKEEERKRNLKVFVEPHFSQLPNDLKQIFSIIHTKLNDSFTLLTFQNMTGLDQREAWQVMRDEFLSANIAIEFRSENGRAVPRPFSVDGYFLGNPDDTEWGQEPQVFRYSELCLPHSRYQLREVAIRQWEESQPKQALKVEAPSAPPVEAPPPVVTDPSMDDSVASFLKERCWVGERVSESKHILMSKYSAWMEGRQATPLTPSEFFNALAGMFDINDKGRVQGLRLLTHSEIQGQGSALASVALPEPAPA